MEEEAISYGMAKKGLSDKRMLETQKKVREKAV